MVLYRGHCCGCSCWLCGGRGVVVAAATADYFPDASSVPPAGAVIEGARDVTLHTDDGLELGAWFLPAAPGSDATDFGMAVLVAPGNGGSRAGGAGLAEEPASAHQP